MVAIFVHGCVWYVSYLGTFLLNGWLELGVLPFVIFTVVFVLGYFVIWAVIYSIIRKKTAKLNAMLKEKQQAAENK